MDPFMEASEKWPTFHRMRLTSKKVEMVIDLFELSEGSGSIYFELPKQSQDEDWNGWSEIKVDKYLAYEK